AQSRNCLRSCRCWVGLSRGGKGNARISRGTSDLGASAPQRLCVSPRRQHTGERLCRRDLTQSRNDAEPRGMETVLGASLASIRSSCGFQGGTNARAYGTELTRRRGRRVSILPVGSSSTPHL